MAKEPDQTKWRGIRPTDPSEDIPTTTKKLAPSIGDLQAIIGNLAVGVSGDNKNCTISYLLSGGFPPVGEIWVITDYMLKNNTSLCDMLVRVYVDGAGAPQRHFNSYEPGEGASWQGIIVLENPDYIQFRWLKGGATDDVEAGYLGYKIGVY